MNFKRKQSSIFFQNFVCKIKNTCSAGKNYKKVLFCTSFLRTAKQLRLFINVFQVKLFWKSASIKRNFSSRVHLEAVNVNFERSYYNKNYKENR